MLVAKGLDASPWHLPLRALLLHPTQPPPAPSAAAFTNTSVSPTLILSKHPEAEVHFTGLQIIIFWFTKFSFKKKTRCRFVLQKQMHSETDFPLNGELCYWRWQGIHEKWSGHCRPSQPEYEQWKRSASDGKDGTRGTCDVRRLRVASVKRHRNRWPPG